MNLLDVAENSVAAGAKLVRIELSVDEEARRLRLAIIDDGKGMDPELANGSPTPSAPAGPAARWGWGCPF